LGDTDTLLSKLNEGASTIDTKTIASLKGKITGNNDAFYSYIDDLSEYNVEGIGHITDRTKDIARTESQEKQSYNTMISTLARGNLHINSNNIQNIAELLKLYKTQIGSDNIITTSKGKIVGTPDMYKLSEDTDFNQLYKLAEKNSLGAAYYDIKELFNNMNDTDPNVTTEAETSAKNIV
jgi:hypothetical protein